MKIVDKILLSIIINTVKILENIYKTSKLFKYQRKFKMT